MWIWTLGIGCWHIGIDSKKNGVYAPFFLCVKLAAELVGRVVFAYALEFVGFVVRSSNGEC